jgi:riboflavin kinase/FMN adenylyltransferase
MVGDDFCYGAKRAGDFDSLKAAGEKYGFEVQQMATVAHPNGARISSSSVRASLVAGDLDAAQVALGRPYIISGHVVHGAKLGRDLGFPTLNLPIAHKRPALAGIFVVRVHGLADEPLPAVASLGLRPTVDDSGRVLLEVFVLDWHGDAYGKLVRVEFLKKLRDEEKYVDLETLSAAIAKDVDNARAYFGLPPASNAGSRATGFAISATDRIR